MKHSRPTLSQIAVFALKEILRQKKWTLLPIWIILLFFVLVVVLSGNSFLLPAIYMVGF